jgi:hypothetical protein
VSDASVVEIVLAVGWVGLMVQIVGIFVCLGLLNESVLDRRLIRRNESRRSYQLQAEDAVICECFRLAGLLILLLYRLPVVAYLLLIDTSILTVPWHSILNAVGPALASVAIAIAGIQERRSREVMRSELKQSRRRGEWGG